MEILQRWLTASPGFGFILLSFRWHVTMAKLIIDGAIGRVWASSLEPGVAWVTATACQSVQALSDLWLTRFEGRVAFRRAIYVASLWLDSTVFCVKRDFLCQNVRRSLRIREYQWMAAEKETVCQCGTCRSSGCSSGNSRSIIINCALVHLVGVSDSSCCGCFKVVVVVW